MRKIMLYIFVSFLFLLHCQTFTDINATLTEVNLSSVAWADYDNDSDLDAFITGWTGSERISRLLQNDSGVFSEINIGLTNVRYSSIEWGDYDNDGDMDILLTGSSDSTNITSIYQNNDGVFADINASLIGVQYSTVAWGDYDNDGDLDIFVSGLSDVGAVSCIYRNDNGLFSNINAGLTGSYYGSADWGDYDNDGDLDLLQVGYYYDGGAHNIGTIYRNDNGLFIDINPNLSKVSNSSASWGDYDNDGDLDIALIGYNGTNRISKIFRNDNGDFVDINANLTGANLGSVAWGDCDNDGDLDLLLTGLTDTMAKISYIYINTGGVFANLNAGLTGMAYSSSAWGDYDNDGDLDILITGYDVTNRYSKIYRNNSISPNSIPITPSNLHSNIIGDYVTLSWDKATDNETPQDGLSYNLYIGTISGEYDLKCPMSNISSGYRRVVSLGNTNQSNSWTAKNLPAGKYYWSVQSIDHNYSGSVFATEQIFSILSYPENVIISILGEEIEISWNAVSDATLYKIYSSNDPYGTFLEETTGTFLGETWTTALAESKKFYYVVAVKE